MNSYGPNFVVSNVDANCSCSGSSSQYPERKLSPGTGHLSTKCLTNNSAIGLLSLYKGAIRDPSLLLGLTAPKPTISEVSSLVATNMSDSSFGSLRKSWTNLRFSPPVDFASYN